MSDYYSKQQDLLLKHLDDLMASKVDHLVANRQMEDREVHQHRGYIAALKELGNFITKELPKLINEAKS